MTRQRTAPRKSFHARGVLARGAALLLALAAVPALSAQQPDARWLAWVGCWQPVEEVADGTLVCIRPISGGVEVSEAVDGEVRSTQTLTADGRAHQTVSAECEGWRSAEFALDGKRLYTHAEQACAGDVARASSGIIALVSPLEWVDVQAWEVDGESVGWTQRYRPADPGLAEAAGFADLAADRGMSTRAARQAAAAMVDIDDIIEASDHVAAEAVRGWIAELNDPFDLDAERLLRMADAGVPPEVIDVMVAVTYPERFAVDREADRQRLAAADRGPRRVYLLGGFMGRRYWNPYGYSPYGYGYGNGYGYGSGYGYGYPYGGYYGPGVVIVAPRQESESDARVVKGRGYTRGRGSSEGARSGASGGSAPSGGSVRRSGGGGTSAPSAGSGSGGSSGGGRKAKPRGG